MDSWVKNKLKEWGFARFENAFAEQEVDCTAFKCLTDHAIREMLPKAGPQSKFLSLWNAEFGKSCSEKSDGSVSDRSLNKSNMAWAFDKSIDVEIIDFSEGFPVPNENLHPSETGICAISQSVPDNPGPSDTNKNKFWRIDTADIALHPCNPITDLIETLRESVEGIAIMHYYKQHRDLLEEHRNYLVEIIISVEMRSSPSFAITPARFEQLSCLICEIFPTEEKAAYYVPYRYDSVTKTKICAKGKLINRHAHRRSYLILSGATEILRGTKRKSLDQPAAVRLAFRKDFENDDCSAEDYKRKIEWLKNSIDPWATVEKYWADTSRRRLKELNDTKNCSSETYLSDFPSLRHPITGTALIDIDFAQTYPDKTNLLLTEYAAFEQEILTFCKTKKKRLDSSVKSLLQTIEATTGNTENDAGRSQDLNSAAVFLLLPLLLPLPAPVKTLNAVRRPSRVEVQCEFLLHVKSIAELEAELSARRSRTVARGERDQPLAVIVGKTLEDIEECYVCINDLRYQVASVLRAIDVTFKSFYALQLDYPKDAVYPWMVLQSRIYAICGETDRIIPSVSKFIGELRQISRLESNRT